MTHELPQGSQQPVVHSGLPAWTGTRTGGTAVGDTEVSGRLIYSGVMSPALMRLPQGNCCKPVRTQSKEKYKEDFYEQGNTEPAD